MAQNPYRTISDTVLAGTSQRYPMVGTFLRCLESDTAFQLSIDEKGYGDFERGMGFDYGREFETFTVKAPAGSDATFTMGVAHGRVDDDRPISGTVGASLVSTVDHAVAPTATEQVLASRATRRAAVVSNLSSTVTLRVGDSNTAAAQGVELGPGERIELATTAAVYVYNPDAAAASVGLLEVDA